jgi:hypothetical protein
MLLKEIKKTEKGLSTFVKKESGIARVSAKLAFAWLAYTFGTISPKKTMAKVTPTV